MPRHTRFLSCILSASLLLAHGAVPAAQTTPTPAQQVLPQPTVDVAGGPGSVSPEPVKPRARPARRIVYSCTTPVLTFADRPCGAQPVLRELVVQPATMPAGAVPATEVWGNDAKRVRTAADGAPSGPGQDDVADAAMQHDDACRKLQSRLEQVDAQMRAGYAAAQAGRLWDRWRDAKQRLRENRC